MQSGGWRLTGRDRAAAAAAAALDAVPSQSIVITGPAGVGRTRLAREILRRAENHQQTTRWASGTAMAAGVPLGALAHLFPSVDASSDPLVLIQRAAQAVIGEGPEPPSLLGVDDVHLLDPLSVTLLHHLAVSGAVTLVLTARSDPLTADPTTPFWKDGLATRVELHPLSRADADRLVAEVLDGDVETRTGEALWRLSQGTPLYLRELVEHGLDTGRLRASRGLWRWHGTVEPSERLATIVLSQLGALDPVEWTALELLASGEPMTVHQVVELSDQDAVAALERRGLITVGHSGRAGLVQMAHPLYSQVVRTRASEAALQLIRGRLGDGPAEASSPEELLRRCAPACGGGVPAPDAARLIEAAHRAVVMLDHPLAERLAKAALDAGVGAEAHLILSEAELWQGRPAASDRWAVEGAAVAVTEDDRARLSACRVLALFCGMGRADEATALLAEAMAATRTPESGIVLAATQACVSFLAGRPADALAQSRAVLATPARGGAARPLAAAAAAMALAVTGETGQALAAAHEGWEALEKLPDATGPAHARIALAQAEILALSLSGRFAELDLRARELYRRNLTSPEWAGDAVACLHRGWAALGCGRPRRAIRWLNEALLGFDRWDAAGLRPLCVALLATAKAVSGDTAGAAELLADLDRANRPPFPAWEPHIRLSHAWVAAAQGRAADAGTSALEAARLAAEQGQWAVEAVMLQSALSFDRGADVVDRLRELAQTLDAPLAVHYVAFAEATVAGSAGRLESVSRAFADAGALLPAADAAAHAGAVHERAGDRRAAAAANARARALAREGGLVITPALDALSAPDLTSREGQVARLAARGMSNLDIADRLVLSVRTVEAHLAHVYGKLGIAGRQGLAQALERTTPPRPRGPLRPTSGEGVVAPHPRMRLAAR